MTKKQEIDYKNSTRLTIDFDCGNCRMTKEEGQWLERLIREESIKMGIKVEKVEWIGLD